MSELQQEYYIPFRANTKDKLFIGRDEKSKRRYYFHTKFNLADGPMVYLNKYKEENLKLGSKTPLPDIFHDFGAMIIPKEFMVFLRNFDIYGLQLFPTVYIDDDDQWHENLWLVNFFEGINCIDKEKSKINYNPKLWEEGDPLVVKKTVFDDSILRAIHEDQRLIFTMDNVDMVYLYCHQRVVDYIREQNYTGIIFVKASDYKRGMENQPGWTGE
ncbi:hypothetical protein I6F65_07670 [Pseudoalteromonas sp. SWXJZ94C]|uniref:imm11 family protein n=1 Tax=Pseudoalteromonas sp. SWXJZ94C TaxID=2792065 RepID=UPI0018CF1737|nr:DUF1629 domain-containing protein [Pseudoalteromonas sp. SWXJZ94C]MBH0056836.1 hypothetical protein [Pseudoalteromonas sp. SWXJZ94C]